MNIPQSARERNPIFVNSRVVGHVAGNVFIKNVQASRHQLRKPPAWCFDIDSLHQAQAAGATIARLVDAESGSTWSVSIDDIWRHGRRFNRGYGDQIFLVLKHWNCLLADGTERHAAKQQEPAAEQLTLFAEVR